MVCKLWRAAHFGVKGLHEYEDKKNIRCFSVLAQI